MLTLIVKYYFDAFVVFHKIQKVLDSSHFDFFYSRTLFHLISFRTNAKVSSLAMYNCSFIGKYDYKLWNKVKSVQN